MTTLAPLARPLLLVVVAIVDIFERLFASSGGLYAVLLYPGFADLRRRTGAGGHGAISIAPMPKVPAYRAFIERMGACPRIRLRPRCCRISPSIPEMDKVATSSNSPLGNA